MDINEITKIVIPEDKDSICRFCLKLSSDLIALNGCSQDIKWSKAGNLSIKVVLNKLCLKIDNATYLPNRICDQCKNCLEDFFIFVERIESNEEILRKVYTEDLFSNSEKDDNSSSSFEDNEELLDIEKLDLQNSSENVIEYEHDYGQTTNTISNLESGKISADNEDSKLIYHDNLSRFSKKNPGTSILKKYESQNKSTAISNSPRVTIHDKSEERPHTPKTRKRRTLKLKDIPEEDEPIYIKQCFFCKRKFSSDDLRTLHYLEHVVQATEGMIPYRPFCFHCGLLTGTKEELNEHITSKHQNEKQLNCVDCKIRFSNIGEMTKHLGKSHIENFEEEINTELKCLICEKVFDNIDNMMKHSLEHISRRHTCITCKTIYICGAALNEHHRTHPQYKYKCPICKKWINSRPSAVRQHKEIHNTVKSYECQICKKKYSSKTHFNYHMKNHSRPNNICPHCGYATKLTKDYVMHLRIHTNERPFKCTFEGCGKAYKTNSALSAHVKEHLNIKNFACEFCDYKTSRSVGLSIHRRIHTGEKPYACKFCGKHFNRQWSLTVHLKKLHPQ